VTEVTFSHSHTCLTPGEQITKYCLKLLPINCPYYTSSSMKATRLSPPVIGVYTEHYIITVTQSGLICCAQHTSLSFASSQQFNREDLQCWNPHKGRNRINSVVENLEYGFPVFQFLRNKQVWELKEVICSTCMSVTLAVALEFSFQLNSLHKFCRFKRAS